MPTRYSYESAYNKKRENGTRLTADNIVAVLKLAIQEQGSLIGKSIEELKLSINFLSADIQDIKGTIQHTVERVSKTKEKIQSLENKVLELARYKRRWNLRLRGLPEEEEVRRKLIKICQKVAPGHDKKFCEVIDSVHRRLGRKETAKAQSRDVILQFSMRHFGDMIWKMSKHSSGKISDLRRILLQKTAKN